MTASGQKSQVVRSPQVLLAPMEGLLDFVLRDVLTRVGGADRCVSEFIRVSGTLLPHRVFLRFMPELLNHSRTAAGVPVRAQLLGSDPVCMAENAASLCELAPEGIDLNFGCPAKVVNRHGGGASMLQDPEAIARVVAAVRSATPAHVPVSAKMRLGFEDTSRMIECAQAMQDGGACEIVVHARTKAQGYRPPAYWHLIAPIREAVRVNVVANGEIWTVADALRCQRESGCADVMLGRGIVANPALARALREAWQADVQPQTPDRSIERFCLGWPELLVHMQHFWALVCARLMPAQRAGRLKQWLNLLRRSSPEAQTAYEQLRTLVDERQITQWLQQQRQMHLHETLPLAMPSDSSE